MQTPAPPHPVDETRRPWSALALLSVAQFMVVLDITVVNVALPSIGADVGLRGDDLQWVVTIYVLLTGGLLLLGGRLADVLPRRSVFLAGLSLFTAASLLSGLAESAGTLIGARAAQGVGAALLTPAALSIVTSYYTGRQRTAALSTWSAIGSAGAAVGVLLGGMLTTWLSWEWIFLVNVPIGVTAALLALRVLPAGAAAGGRRALDLPGALLVVAGLVVLVYGIEGAAEHGWGSARTLVLMALGLGLLASFARVEAASRQPLVPPAIWRVRPLVGGAALILVVTGILVGTFFLNSIYMQGAIGASALETGLGFLPLAIAIGIGAHVASHLLPKVGSRVLLAAGFLLTAAGALGLAAAPGDASYLTDLLPGLLPIGVGVGLVFPAASVSAMHDVEHSQAGLASGMLSTAHEVGAALGVAVLAAVAAIGDAGGHGAALAGGYEDGFIAAAVIALAAAALARFALPTVKPAASAQAMAH
jgi:EmrB/QacA subfamily drug resistance transporter